MENECNSLYDSLLNEKIQITKKDITFVNKTLKNISKDKQEQIFVLIVEHSRRNNGYSLKEIAWENILPYEGIKTDEGISFDFKKLPETLQSIIFKFLNIS